MSRIIIPICWCPHCHNQIRVIAHDMRVDLEPIEPVLDEPKPSDKPPGVGDWVVHRDGWVFPEKPIRVQDVSGPVVCFAGGSKTGMGFVRIVRRSDAPLQKGDRVTFGSEEGWVRGLYTVGIAPNLVNFTANRPLESGDSHGYFKTKDLTLTEPVYPDGEKLSGKEKED